VGGRRRGPSLWAGAQSFYKVEPVVADGGWVVLFAPHIGQIAATHPEIERIDITAGVISRRLGALPAPALE
jgi:hypothetical protein